MGRIRIQVVIAVIAIVVFIGAMGYVAFNVTTLQVADYGGVYVEGVVGNPQAINPILSQANALDQDLVSLIFNGLTRINEHGEVVPDLAERWDVSPDGTTYTFYLRQDVLWHDGAPFTASDVIFTINAIQNPDYQGMSYLSSLWRSVTVEQVDAYTVRFRLREPYVPFLDYTSIGILPVHLLGNVPIASLAAAKFNAEPVGTGPFRVAEVNARKIALVANQNYYKTRPYLDRVEFIFYPNDEAVFEARKRGEIAGISRVLPDNLDAVRKDKSLDLYSAPLSGYTTVFLNLDKAIFQDVQVRQALMWALDRQQLVDDVLGGQGVVINSPILPNTWAYADDLGGYTYDPAKAKALLEQAGWVDENGDRILEKGDMTLEFTLTTNEDDPVRVALIHAIADQLAKVGIRVTPQTTSWETLVGEMLRKRRYDAVLGGWQNLPADPDPYAYWHSSQATEDGLNFPNYINPEVDTLLEQGRSTLDLQQRITLYRRFQEIFIDEVPSLILYQPIYNYAVDAKVNDVQVGTMFSSADRFRTITDWYMVTQRMLHSEATQSSPTTTVD
ncbi:MAG: ABC transporter substrate-binding protein [Chloroflexi bacterium]|nr:ABC transporter substrate-binding protein [Chloroflexota bacterium]